MWSTWWQRNFAHVTTLLLSWHTQTHTDIFDLNSELTTYSIWQHFKQTKQLSRLKRILSGPLSIQGNTNCFPDIDTVCLIRNAQCYGVLDCLFGNSSFSSVLFSVFIYIHLKSINWSSYCFGRIIDEALRVVGNMMTSSNGNIFRITGPLCGEFTDHRWIPHTKPVTRSFDVFFDLCLNKRLAKQSWGWSFVTSSR